MWIEVRSTSRKQCAVVAISPYKRSFSSTARSAKVSHAGEIAERNAIPVFGLGERVWRLRNQGSQE